MQSGVDSETKEELDIETQRISSFYPLYCQYRAFSSNFGKRPLAKIGEKMIDLTSKLGEIKDIEHNKGSKIYPQNQVILDCIMPSIPLKHKCLSIILIWVIVSHKQ